MSETKVTPGPWKVRDRHESPITSMVEEGVSKDDFPYSIEVPSPPFAFGKVAALVVDEAHANLIAAAPDLLAALANLLAATDNGTIACDSKDVWRARQAIAKARAR